MLALVLLGLSASALTPDTAFPQGVEPLRVQRYHLERQHALRHEARWQGFLAGEGAGWQARFDEHSGSLASAWGPGIPLGETGSGPELEAAILAFLARNPGLVGAPTGQLRLQALARDAQQDAWTVTLAQVVPAPAGLTAAALGSTPALPTDLVLDPLGRGGALADDRPDFTPALDAQGLDVLGGTLRLRVVKGRLIHLQDRTDPLAAGAASLPLLTADRAVEIALGQGPAAAAAHRVEGARLVVMPGQGRTAWEVRSRVDAPPGLWLSLVDARTGELLSAWDMIRYLEGTLSGVHDTRTVDGNFSTSPLVNLLVTGQEGDAMYTDALDGSWSLPNSSSGQTRFYGDFFEISNQAGAEAEVSFTGDYTWTSDAASQAEIDSYVFLSQVHDWKELYAPEVSMGGRMRSNVNLNSYCNAYFDGDVNFFREGGGCNNSGRIADVNYHEWGHGLHYYSLESGSFDGSMSEGIADTVAFFQTGDPVIGPYFQTNGSGIREVATDLSYPDDVVGEVHSDGLIFAGAIWDLWAVLEADLGETAGYDAAVDVMLDLIKFGPDLSGVYEAALLGDDDNGDLSDGTPHQCAILEAFIPHGLGPEAGTPLIALSHLPLENQASTAVDYPVAADILNLAPLCFDFEVQTARAYYRVAGAADWQSVDLGVVDGTVQGALPAQEPGTIVEYYLEVTSIDGDEAAAPAGAEINPFSFVVGDLVEIACFDFEDDDGDFSHDLLAGDDELGADDWIWGRPTGFADDPEMAFSGERVWGNDLGGGNYNGEYQPDKHNRLRSVPVDVSGYEGIVLQYRRWLAVEDGYFDTAQVVQIHGGDDDDVTVLWDNHESTGGSSADHSEHTVDLQWALHTLAVNPGGEAEVQIGWDIVSDSGLEMGGWNIDDVCLYALSGSGSSGDGGAGDGGAGDGGSGEDSGLTGDAGASADGGGEEEDWKIKAHGCDCSAASGSAAPGSSLPAMGFGLLLAGLAGARRRRG